MCLTQFNSNTGASEAPKRQINNKYTDKMKTHSTCEHFIMIQFTFILLTVLNIFIFPISRYTYRLNLSILYLYFIRNYIAETESIDLSIGEVRMKIN